jgi:hypothetical protein
MPSYTNMEKLKKNFRLCTTVSRLHTKENYAQNKITKIYNNLFIIPIAVTMQIGHKFFLQLFTVTFKSSLPDFMGL